MSQNDVELDLDALAPKVVEIKFQDKLIKVTPPTLEQFAKILSISDEMRAVSSEEGISQALPIYGKALTVIREVVPDFNDFELNYIQIMALFKLLMDLAAPNDDKAIAELKKRGINLAATPEGEVVPKASASSQ